MDTQIKRCYRGAVGGGQLAFQGGHKYPNSTSLNNTMIIMIIVPHIADH